MRKLITILTILLCFNCYSQYATKAYVDSLYKTVDSVVVRTTKITTTNQQIYLDTIKIPNNTSATFTVTLETDTDNAIKVIQIRNLTNIYSLIRDDNLKSLRTVGGWFSKTPSWETVLQNNLIIIRGTGQSGTNMKWLIKRTVW
jgi:hypothetical protein